MSAILFRGREKIQQAWNYEAMLADPALSEAERTAFLEVLWEIVVGFVDLGFHIHPLQQVEALPPHERVDDPSE